ncbi:hypothetical protein BGW36DRAFT_355264 [Talaromyces proteolyticus]|uniref:Xylanolytic transcriptional activator regulatory domain-containing protein n=1 Tax=Talaromyces proteolyticus TaxID=1131652 RepID=A0AAD4Q532_9EURO|nr:uncharacterized protein BGW36DRAFT_355264 [Talaromyces proteolyticus]KAH8703866.1 hypothetical protein BGW36DRAFT_355264 [Talaromyces proteolyticus]
MCPSHSEENFLPLFIRPLSSDLDVHDWKYLSSKGTFALPNSDFQNALLRAYIEHVHPLLPILELESFVKAVFSPQNHGTSKLRKSVSLILYWAVMYAAIPAVPLHALHKAGYYSHHDAQCSFHMRIQALYNVEAELDRLSLVQALLLVVYRQDITKQIKDMTYWMTIIWSYMQELGIDVQIGRKVKPTGNHQRKIALYRRLWWSCFICDRLVGLAACADPVLPQPGSIPPLKLDDLEIFHYPGYIIQALGDGNFSDFDLSLHLGRLCVIQTQVCILLDQVISGPHGRSPNQLLHVATNQAISEANRLAGYKADLLKHHDQITFYILQRDSPLKIIDPVRLSQVKSCGPAYIHEMVLFIVIDAILAFLLQRQIVLQEILCGRDGGHGKRGTAEELDSYRLNHFLRQSRIVTIHRVCSRLKDLKQSGELQKLRPTIVGLLLPAAIHYLTQVREEGQNIHDSIGNAGYFDECLSILKLLGKHYPSIGQWAVYLQKAAMSCSVPCPSSLPYTHHQERLEDSIISDTETKILSDFDMYQEPIQACMRWWFGDGNAMS